MKRPGSRPAARIAALLALLAALPAAARAQESPLDALVREGIRNNLGLRQERLEDARSEAAVRQARGLYLPAVSLDARYSRTSGVLDIGDLVNPAYAALNQLTRSDAFPTDVDARLPLAQETKLRLTQPLFQPAVRENHRLARSLRGLQGAELAAATRQLAADVQAAYLGHASAVRVVETYRATLPLLDENLRVNERLVVGGRATSEGVYRARAERSETQQKLAEAERQRDAAARGLNFLLGRPLDAPVDVLPDSALDAAVEVPLDGALRSALAAREELAQADFGIRAAESQGRLARASYLPGVSLAVDYGVQGQRYRFGPDDDFAVASLVLQWSVFNGGQDAARGQAARLDTERARTRRAELERAVEMQVKQAWEAVASARTARAAADDRLAAARRTFELVSRRYEEGIAPHIE
ncbi:MAG TPA: TolC family protein, partial [Longimicrobiaceae bacterium]|nr:TolC family protein [Longimicrobiaceae bacterium]